MLSQELLEGSVGVVALCGEDLNVDAGDAVLGVSKDIVGVLLEDDLLIVVVALGVVGAQSQGVLNGIQLAVTAEAVEVVRADQVEPSLGTGGENAAGDVVHGVELVDFIGEGVLEVVLAVLLVGLDADLIPQLLVEAVLGAGIVLLGAGDSAGGAVGSLRAAEQVVGLAHDVSVGRDVVVELNRTVVEGSAVSVGSAGGVLHIADVDLEAPGLCHAVAVSVVHSHGLLLGQAGNPVIAVLGGVHEVLEVGASEVIPQIADNRALVVEVVQRAGVSDFEDVIVAGPVGVGLVGQISGDGALGQDAEAVANDVVLGAKGHAGVVHVVGAVLIQGDAGQAALDRVALHDAEQVGTVVVTQLGVGVDAVRNGNSIHHGVDSIFVGSADLVHGLRSVDVLVALLVGGGHSGEDVAAQLAFHALEGIRKVISGVSAEVVTVDVGAVPLFFGNGSLGGLGGRSSGLARVAGLRGGLVLTGCGGRFLLVAANEQGGDHRDNQQDSKKLLEVHHCLSSINNFIFTASRRKYHRKLRPQGSGFPRKLPGKPVLNGRKHIVSKFHLL